MLTYKDQTKPDTGRARIAVYCEGRLTGHIKGTFDSRFAYTPKGSKTCGDSFRSIEAVKQSLEGDDA